MAEQSYTRDQVNAAVNRACDEVQELINEHQPRDYEVPIDATNFVVNVGLHYLEQPDADMRDAIGAAWGGDEIDNVLGWFGVEQPELAEEVA